MHHHELLKLLANHHSRFMDEVAYVRQAIDFIKANENVFERAAPVHVTGSVWVVSPDRQKVLLMHHRKYGQWFQPGGHADGDADVLRVALRECAEETGVDPAHIKLLDPAIFDVDIHDVPRVGQVLAHGHIDIRFAVEIDDRLPIPGNNESHEVKWFSLYQVMQMNRFRSTYRMLEKTRAMRNPVYVLRQRSA
jgi:8-oxo-dGTP pyrophosphatase MutT (NUDIX family)